MGVDLSEKPDTLAEDESGRASSPGESTDGAHIEKETAANADLGADLQKADTKVEVATPSEEDEYKHLPAKEAEILRRQVSTPDVKAGVAILYRYASKWDLIFMGVSTICAIGGGAALPLMTVIFGNLQHTFENYFLGLESYHDFMHTMSTLVLYFVYLAIGEVGNPYIPFQPANQPSNVGLR
jgi:ATP-binding cassette, subfamily B (MDR/TAP), member 1